MYMGVGIYIYIYRHIISMCDRVRVGGVGEVGGFQDPYWLMKKDKMSWYQTGAATHFSALIMPKQLSHFLPPCQQSSTIRTGFHVEIDTFSMILDMGQGFGNGSLASYIVFKAYKKDPIACSIIEAYGLREG